MDEKIQDNSIFEAELSERYQEELLTDIPDIWDKINARLDSIPAASSDNENVADSITNISSTISSDYLPTEEAAPVIRYNKAAAKSSHGFKASSALTRFAPIAAAVVLLCICVPVFIKLQHNNSSESATAPAYETDSAYATLNVDNSKASYSAENKVAGDTYSAGETFEYDYTEEAEESCDSVEALSEERSTEESTAYDGDAAGAGACIMIYVVPDTDYSKITELISVYDMELESDSSNPNAYKLLPNQAMDKKELSRICDEIRKYDFIVQATPIDS